MPNHRKAKIDHLSHVSYSCACMGTCHKVNLPFWYRWLISSRTGFRNVVIVGFCLLYHMPARSIYKKPTGHKWTVWKMDPTHNVTFYFVYLWCFAISLTTIHTGHTLTFEEWKLATPSVLISSETWELLHRNWLCSLYFCPSYIIYITNIFTSRSRKSSL